MTNVFNSGLWATLANKITATHTTLRRIASPNARRRSFAAHCTSHAAQVSQLEPRVLLAGTLANGEEVIGSLSVGTSETFDFAANVGATVVVSLGEQSSTSSSQVTLIIRDASSQVVFANSGPTAITARFIATATQTYEITVAETDDNAALDYRLRAFQSRSPIPGSSQIAGRDEALPSGGEVETSIPIGAFNVHRVTASVGQGIHIALGEQVSNSSSGVVIQVFDPNGQRIEPSSGPIATSILFTATTTGAYQVLVNDPEFDGELNYRIRMVKTTANVQQIPGRDTTLRDGLEEESTIPIGSFNTHRFSATAGQSLKIIVGEATTSGASTDPRIQIFDPQGLRILDRVDDQTIVHEFTAQKTGFYLIIVSDSPNESTMSYRIRFAKTNAGTRLIGGRDSLLRSGDEVESSIPLSSFNIHNITVSIGQTAQIVVGEQSSTSSTNVRLQVYDPTGQLVSDSIGSIATAFRFTAVETGTYAVFVSDPEADAALSYRLRYSKIGASRRPIAGRDSTLLDGQTVSSAIPLASFDAHEFNASAGQTVQLDFSETPSVSSSTVLLEVFGPDGQRLEISNTSAGETVTVGIGRTGKYFVLVRDEFSDGALAYEITMTFVS